MPSAVSQRSRRVTAGKRMSDLVGKALEDDEAFWSHDTWNEHGDDGDDNNSFHESDEDSAERVDTFDSDFNDSESDNEAEEEAAGAAEEEALRKEEKKQQRRKQQHRGIDLAMAGRELQQRKRGRIKGNRIFGDGINAGLVLNLPKNFEFSSVVAPPVAGPDAATTTSGPLMPPNTHVSAAADGGGGGGDIRTAPPAASPFAPVKVSSSTVSPTPQNKITLASTRARRGGGFAGAGGRKRRKTTEESTKASRAEKRNRVSSNAGATKRRKPVQKFTQEELLLEAATKTEPENKRWLLARKRLHEQAEAAAAVQQTSAGSGNSKVLQRYVSKRGFFNTLNFPEMDAVPQILMTHKTPAVVPKRTYCVITGKRAKYKDPKTGFGYFDLAAFREIRRRLGAGEPVDQREERKGAASDKRIASKKMAVEDEEVPGLEAEQQQKQQTAPTAVVGSHRPSPAAARTAPKPIKQDKPQAKSTVATTKARPSSKVLSVEMVEPIESRKGPKGAARTQLSSQGGTPRKNEASAPEAVPAKGKAALSKGVDLSTMASNQRKTVEGDGSGTVRKKKKKTSPSAELSKKIAGDRGQVTANKSTNKTEQPEAASPLSTKPKASREKATAEGNKPKSSRRSDGGAQEKAKGTTDNPTEKRKQPRENNKGSKTSGEKKQGSAGTDWKESESAKKSTEPSESKAPRPKQPTQVGSRPGSSLPANTMTPQASSPSSVLLNQRPPLLHTAAVPTMGAVPSAGLLPGMIRRNMAAQHLMAQPPHVMVPGVLPTGPPPPHHHHHPPHPMVSHAMVNPQLTLQNQAYAATGALAVSNPALMNPAPPTAPKAPPQPATAGIQFAQTVVNTALAAYVQQRKSSDDLASGDTPTRNKQF